MKKMLGVKLPEGFFTAMFGIGAFMLLSGILLELMASKKTPAQMMVNKYTKEAKVATAITSGCLTMGLSDDMLGPVLIETQGKVCASIIQAEVTNETSEKALCKDGDSECLFVLGFVKTALVLGYPSEPADVKAMETQAKELFAKRKDMGGI